MTREQKKDRNLITIFLTPFSFLNHFNNFRILGSIPNCFAHFFFIFTFLFMGILLFSICSYFFNFSMDFRKKLKTSLALRTYFFFKFMIEFAFFLFFYKCNCLWAEIVYYKTFLSSQQALITGPNVQKHRKILNFHRIN